MCGEKCSSCFISHRMPGSPPRMRGKGRFLPGDALRVGITPAYARKSKYCHFPTSLDWDYPRVCGEKVGAGLFQEAVLGSSPRMRGKEENAQGWQAVSRITPAYAGKSSQRSSATRSARDHPRVCGEKSVTLILLMVRVGSPPRMRGKEMMEIRAVIEEGITPAYAGKSAGCEDPHPQCGITPACAGKSHLP